MDYSIAGKIAFMIGEVTVVDAADPEDDAVQTVDIGNYCQSDALGALLEVSVTGDAGDSVTIDGLVGPAATVVCQVDDVPVTRLVCVALDTNRMFTYSASAGSVDDVTIKLLAVIVP